MFIFDELNNYVGVKIIDKDEEFKFFCNNYKVLAYAKFELDNDIEFHSYYANNNAFYIKSKCKYLTIRERSYWINQKYITKNIFQIIYILILTLLKYNN